MILVYTLIILLILLFIYYILSNIPRFFKWLAKRLGFRPREGLENMFDAISTDKISTDKISTDNISTDKISTDNPISKPISKPTANSSKTYKDPGLNDNPLYLATLNAANISYLKEQVDELSGLKQEVNELKTQTDTNTTSITALGEQMSTYAQEVTGREANSTEPIPVATGLE